MSDRHNASPVRRVLAQSTHPTVGLGDITLLDIRLSGFRTLR